MDRPTSERAPEHEIPDVCGHGHDHDHHDAHAHHCSGPAVRPEVALVSARGLGLVRSGRTILDHIDLDISPGEIVTLIGPNGAGKTSLVRVLLGLTAPSCGTVWRKPGLAIGYAPQKFDVGTSIPLTVDRFLKLGGQPAEAEIARVLGEVGAIRVRASQMSALSGGEMQRVILARALLRNPALIVLDEPVRGVDYAGEAEMYDLIAGLRDRYGMSVLLVSHDLHVVMARSDRVLCLNRHLCCSGVPVEVAKSPAYEAMFGPEAARAFAIYHHAHNHRHDLAGAAVPRQDIEQAAVPPR